MKTVMNKQLYNFTQDKFQKYRQGGQIKNSALATKLYEEYNFGQLDINKQWLSFTLDNLLALSDEIQSALSLDIRQDPYPIKEDRLTTSEKFRNEKDNSYAVSKDFILINSLSELNVNQNCHEISPLTSLGMYIKADDIQSVEHTSIVLVENLAVMANLTSINLASLNNKISNTNCLSNNLDLTQALWLYRGDVKAQQTSNTSYQFFRRFKGKVPLVCFSDVDPKGIEIALTSDADYWLTIKNIDDLAMPLSGTEQEWYKQGASISFLQEQLSNIPSQKIDCWENIFLNLRTYRKTLKQEHILKHNVALVLIELT
ncbi:hypothetical protein ESZ36_18610 [Colwellia demingiae]|uniref:DUF7281 domain-containing protein n=1 Tax=Colwellia demingiae TaxID=89401 RepID=A0A5C6Q8F2_9GAMM|nr:hypothetical protein [Colwellia demingiae]TWX65285.1 hypothetical protein ESZ36_18610 [Colwellia demingiae]